MSATARRRAGFTAGGLGVLAAVILSGFAAPVHFEAVGRDYARWVERFSAGQPDAVVDSADGGPAVPYILPGPADAWAGGTPHRLHVRFAAPREEVLLLLVAPDAHDQSPPRLTVAVNGRDVGEIRVARGKGLPPPHEGAGPPRQYALRIPAAALEPGGAQRLTLTNASGSWVTLGSLALQSAAPRFSPANLVDQSPPPRAALVALAVALLAFVAADPRPLRSRAPSLLLLVPSLAFLGFLEVADDHLAGWDVVLGTHRAVWLLLGIGFAVPLLPPLPGARPGRRLALTVFLTGAAGMVLELVGFRLLSPFFGYSIYVWGALLAVVMAALAAGYYAGGWLAERAADGRTAGPRLLSSALLGTAMVLLLTPLAYPAIVRLTVDLPLVAGVLLASALLLLLPMVGLALVPPVAIRLLASGGTVGLTAGRVYALSTVGSILGTFASAFLLVTRLGPQESWVATGLVLFLLGAHQLAGEPARRAVVAAHWLGLLLVFGQPWVPEISVAALKGGTRIASTESEYSHIEVIEVGKSLQLVPQLRFTHTIYTPDRVYEPIISYGLLPSFLTEPGRVLHLGMGGGTLARLYLHAHPAARVDGVDIDPEMIRLGRQFLGLRDDPRLRIVVDDARAFLLRRADAPYDVVVWDLFQGGVFVPYYTVTREFFELVRERLSGRGVVAAFVARPRPIDTPARVARYHRVFASVGNTLASVFPSVFTYPVSDIGFYFVATRSPTTLAAVRARLEALAIPELAEPVRGALRGLAEYRPDPAVAPLTDDLAPIDQFIYDAFFRR
ncbi:MAG TPA: fused MFS/spermidine synthase [Methylomirabilota bacterium]|nr:fused MFS/spermidine synthase [Methylomirabilota bacterium]